MKENFAIFGMGILIILMTSRCDKDVCVDNIRNCEKINSTASQNSTKTQADTNTLVLEVHSNKIKVKTSVTLTPKGGQSPYTLSQTDGLGLLNNDTGIYHAPSTAGTAVIQVTDVDRRVATVTLEIVE